MSTQKKRDEGRAGKASGRCEVDPPNVLFAVFQTSNAANGGVESISQIIDRFPENRCVVTQLSSKVNERWERSGKKVEVFDLPYRVGEGFWKSPLRIKLKRMLSYCATNWKTLRLIRSQRIDVLHCNDPAPFWHVVPAAVLCRVPVVLNLRDSNSSHGSATIWKYRLRFLFVDRLLVLSREMADLYEALVGRNFLRRCGLKIEFIYSIVDTHRMRPVPEAARQRSRYKLGIAEGEHAIGFVAAFSDKKNQVDFIEKAAGELAKKLPKARVYFIGDFAPDENNYAKLCQGICARKGLDHFLHFPGYCERVEEWYRALDLVVVPTRREGLARCMIEAIASGVPVVSFDVCSAREILSEHDCGVVVPQGDYRSLVDAVVTLLIDPSRRKTLSINGPQVAAQKFSGDEVFDRYLKLYAGLVNAASDHCPA
jgi:glycosyltransferase involved in cell wall biosynthesis